VGIRKIIVVGDGGSNMFQFFTFFSPFQNFLLVTRTLIRFSINPKHSICQIWLFVGEFEMGVGNGNYNIFGVFVAEFLRLDLFN
jgi:hypothetical protein